jgi:hypothetical protein
LPQTINSDFINNFKLGDNIVYNISVLSTLYELREGVTGVKRQHVNKPIILIAVSIIEAAMFDFLDRVKKNTREGVSSLPANVINHFRAKKIDKLEMYIVHFKKHSIFDDAEFDIYGILDELRKLRNRIHIQNEKKHFAQNDYDAFSNARLRKSEQCLEFTLRTFSDNHSRTSPQVVGHVVDFELPFDQHFEKGNATHSAMTLDPKRSL